MIYPFWSVFWPYFVAAVAASYLIGSVPFGLVLTRLAGFGDLRNFGSGNIGATNVLRTGNKPLALMTLFLDGGKGALAVAIGNAYWGPEIAIVAALGSLMGHLFPVWLRFQGGKGAAIGRHLAESFIETNRTGHMVPQALGGEEHLAVGPPRILGRFGPDGIEALLDGAGALVGGENAATRRAHGLDGFLEGFSHGRRG